MGYDFYIKARFAVCEITGQLYYYSLNPLTRHYDLSKIVVPEQYRRFLYLRGRMYHLYTQDVSNDDWFQTEISELVETFPSWEDIEESGFAEDYDWKEEDHNQFREALEWFANQDGIFYASWSY